MPPKKLWKRKAEEMSEASTKILKKPKLKPCFSKPSEMVTIIVGPEGKEEKFIVHKEFACHHSPVLKAAFDGPFAEGASQSYRLEDTSPETFQLLVAWLYTQKIDIPSAATIAFKALARSKKAKKAELSKGDVVEEEEKEEGKDGEGEEDEDAEDEEEDFGDMTKFSYLETYLEDNPEYFDELHVVQLWIVADQLLMRSLQNAVMNHFDLHWGKFAAPEYTSWFRYLYKHTSDDSPLRQMIVDRCAYNTRDFLPDKGLFSYHFPKEMLVDVFIALNQADRDKDSPNFICKKIWRNYLVPEDE